MGVVINVILQCHLCDANTVRCESDFFKAPMRTAAATMIGSLYALNLRLK